MAVTSKRTKRKARQRPPWGKLADGKPIEDFGRTYHRVKVDDVSEVGHAKKEKNVRNEFGESARQYQFKKMLLVKKYYGIEGESGWRPWYDLALAIASEFDPSLKIVDPIPEKTGKTAPRWRGTRGSLLIDEVAALGGGKGRGKVLAVLQLLREMCPDRYRTYSLNVMEANYYSAVAYAAKKQSKN